MDDYLLIIDGSSLLTTQFFGNLPREILFAKELSEKEKYFHKIMMTKDGVYTNAVFGFLRTFLKILKDQKPTHVAVCWDLTRDTFRRRLYPDYKGNRSETLKPLSDQFGLMQEILKKIGVREFMDLEYEADDFCGSLCAKFEDQIPVKIFTKDHDYLQLVTDKTHMWLMHSSQEQTEKMYEKYKMVHGTDVPDRAFELDPSLVLEEFGVYAENINSLKGLEGDPSDNIKGVLGVGHETAVKLIREYRTVGKLYEVIHAAEKAGADTNGDGKVSKKEASAGLDALKLKWKTELGITRSPLAYLCKESSDEGGLDLAGTNGSLVGEKAAFLSEQLATIKKDIDLEDLSLDDLRLNLDLAAFDHVLSELEFKSISVDFLKAGSRSELVISESFSEITDFGEVEKFVGGIQKGYKVGLAYLEGQGLAVAVEEKDDTVGSTSGFSNGFDGERNAGRVVKTTLIKEFFFITKEVLKDVCIKIIEKATGKKRAENEGSSGQNDGSFDVNATCFDGKSLYYLCNFSLPDVSLMAYLDNPITNDYSEKEILNSYLDIHEVVTEDKKVLYQAYVALTGFEVLHKSLVEKGMWELFTTMEMPLQGLLCRMEMEGIGIDRDALKEYSASLKERIDVLEKEVWELAGEEFNINSPKQLGEVLFVKLGLPYEKKSKAGGFSTAAEVLEKLAPDYPVVAKVLEYRTYAKLRSTYAEGLQEYIQNDGRIHGRFNQTVTATGRISSDSPNLQNIPMRMELGRLIRKVFVAKPGCAFVDADYSQIELRVLAHLSGDENLIQAYQEARDIHAKTASLIFHVPMEEVTSEMRRKAKIVNFGIVYGMSAFSLSQDLGVSRKEAERFMEEYFASYPGIQGYMKGQVSFGYDHGFVRTAYGRVRPVPELASSNFNIRSFGERVAMNSPIQGTAADIMKLAMLTTEKALREGGFQSKIVLQVHDELVIEALDSELEAVKTLLISAMENCVSMAVPMVVEANQGATLYDSK